MKDPKVHKNPWKKISGRTAYKNPWIRVREDKVIRPDGKKGIYGILEIPNGVAVVALDKENKVYLIGEWRYPIFKYSWSVICGTRDKDESPLASAKRELLEEANVKAKKWKKLITFHTTPGISDEKVFVYLATDLESAYGKQEETEMIRVKKVKFEKALEMIEKGNITDSYAIISLLKAKEKIKYGNKK